MIRGIQDHAVELEARAKTLAESDIENLRVAAARVQSAEAARSAAEKTLSELSARLQKAERELTRMQLRNAAAEMQLANAEQRMNAAEARAVSAEKAVNQIENAIRTQLRLSSSVRVSEPLRRSWPERRPRPERLSSSLIAAPPVAILISTSSRRPFGTMVAGDICPVRTVEHQPSSWERGSS
jgi:DNA repair exonuclease SbcCD ATPase subunit